MVVTLYSNHCPQCEVLESELRKNSINFNIIRDVDLMLSKGFKTVPKLEVDGKVMDMPEALKWIKEGMNK